MVFQERNVEGILESDFKKLQNQNENIVYLLIDAGLLVYKGDIVAVFNKRDGRITDSRWPYIKYDSFRKKEKEEEKKEEVVEEKKEEVEVKEIVFSEYSRFVDEFFEQLEDLSLEKMLQ